jgi:hypothetical protein
MRHFRMVVVQVRSQMVSNYNVPGHSRLEKAQLLLLIADESERGVLVTAEWLAPRPVKPPVERESGPISREGL